MWVNVGSMYLRETSAADGKIVATVSRGTELPVTGKTEGDRTQVIYQGVERWAYTAFLSKSAPAPAPKGVTLTGYNKLNKNSKAVVAAVVANFPKVNTIHGWRSYSAYSSDHPNGRAVDIMIPDWKGSGVQYGTEVAEYFKKNAASTGSLHHLASGCGTSRIRPAAGVQWRTGPGDATTTTRPRRSTTDRAGRAGTSWPTSTEQNDAVDEEQHWELRRAAETGGCEGYHREQHRRAQHEQVRGDRRGSRSARQPAVTSTAGIVRPNSTPTHLTQVAHTLHRRRVPLGWSTATGEETIMAISTASATGAPSRPTRSSRNAAMLGEQHYRQHHDDGSASRADLPAVLHEARSDLHRPASSRWASAPRRNRSVDLEVVSLHTHLTNQEECRR